VFHEVEWRACGAYVPTPCLGVGRGEVTRTNRRAEGINSRVKFLPLAWAGMPKTSFRKNSDSPPTILATKNFLRDR
jgi:hypothetical protein